VLRALQVTCSVLYISKNKAKERKKMNIKLDREISKAVLVAWDGCHKIYLAMDHTEADWFEQSEGYETARGNREVMKLKVRSWYKNSCELRFISAVSEHDDYTVLVGQDF
jgi:hypothetical protein